jgi:hypothetical protein
VDDLVVIEYRNDQPTVIGFVENPGVCISVALSGTVTAAINESDIVNGGKTIVLTLTGGTWVASGSAFDAIRQDIIDGLDSAQSESTGFDAEVVPAISVADVVRTSDNVVTITLPAVSGYDITAQETVTDTAPASAIQGASSDVVAEPTFSIDTGASYDYNWIYGDQSAHGLGDGFHGACPKNGSIEGTINLESGESLDFTGPWDYQDSFYRQKSDGNKIYTIYDDGGTYGQYFISENGNNDATREEICTLFGISETANQHFYKS